MGGWILWRLDTVNEGVRGWSEELEASYVYLMSIIQGSQTNRGRAGVDLLPVLPIPRRGGSDHRRGPRPIGARQRHHHLRVGAERRVRRALSGRGRAGRASAGRASRRVR